MRGALEWRGDLPSPPSSSHSFAHCCQIRMGSPLLAPPRLHDGQDGGGVNREGLWSRQDGSGAGHWAGRWSVVYGRRSGFYGREGLGCCQSRMVGGALRSYRQDYEGVGWISCRGQGMKVVGKSWPEGTRSAHAVQGDGMQVDSEPVAESINDIDEDGSKLIEVGHVSRTHGIQGEVIVNPDTAFGELRFSKPGKRWLRRKVFGEETIEVVDLVKGRAHVGKKTWIVTFRGYNTIELSQQLIGSTVLVSEDDRPEMEDGDVYLKDVVGMRVILKENGNLIGTVISVVHAGDCPLLRIRIDSCDSLSDKAREAIGEEEFHAWLPFVEHIVHVFDIERREIQIDPPEGLLEVNLPTHKNSNNDCKKRILLKKKVTDAKKHLLLMGQGHVLDMLAVGENDKRLQFANQIISINANLLNIVLRKIELPTNRWDLSKFLQNNSSKVGKASLKMHEETEYSLFKRRKIGLDLMDEAKVAIVLLLNGATHSNNDKDPSFSSHCLELFSQVKFLKMEKRKLVPLVLVCPTGESESARKIFAENDYFGFDMQKVWFLEEERLPTVSNNSSHSILMKLPWEVMESPLGSGGVITLLSSNTILETLVQSGIDYIQVCDSSSGQRSEGVTSLLLGFLAGSNADVGIEMGKGYEDIERLEMVFRMGFLRTVVGRVEDLPFCGAVWMSRHFEVSDKEWTDIIPFYPNSLCFSCSLESALELSPPEKIFVLEIER